MWLVISCSFLNVSFHLWWADDASSFPLVFTSSNHHLSRASPHVWRDLSETATKQLSSHFRSPFFPVMPDRNLDKLIVCQGRSLSCWLIFLVFPGWLGASDVFCFKQGSSFLSHLSEQGPGPWSQGHRDKLYFTLGTGEELSQAFATLSSSAPNDTTTLFISASLYLCHNQDEATSPRNQPAGCHLMANNIICFVTVCHSFCWSWGR